MKRYVPLTSFQHQEGFVFLRKGSKKRDNNWKKQCLNMLHWRQINLHTYISYILTHWMTTSMVLVCLWLEWIIYRLVHNRHSFILKTKKKTKRLQTETNKKKHEPLIGCWLLSHNHIHTSIFLISDWMVPDRIDFYCYWYFIQ